MNEEQPQDQPQPVAENEHVAPGLQGTAFHCMHCGVLAQQTWQVLRAGAGPQSYSSGYWYCTCRNCTEISIWNEFNGRCVDPIIGGGPRPHLEMPEDVRQDYEEARRIVGIVHEHCRVAYLDEVQTARSLRSTRTECR